MGNNSKFSLSICFVCHGNICRSPYAEAYARKEAKKRHWENKVLIDSAGTSAEHLGEPPHPLSRAMGERVGLEMNHIARQFQDDEFEKWDYIVLMDRNNLRNLQRLPRFEQFKDKVSLLREWDEYATSQIVPDPWGMGERAYDEMSEIICSAMVEFFDHLEKNHKI